jgi:hypothetical protein
VVDGLEPDRLARIVDTLVTYEPSTTAVLVRGSYAKGLADPSSDLDLSAITPQPRERYRMWFDGDLHVSADAKTAAEWLGRRLQPASWSFGLPAREDAAYVFADEPTRNLLGDPPSVDRPAGTPQLEDLVEYARKVRRLAAAGDDRGARLYAHRGAELAPALLVALNAPRPALDRLDALHLALSFPVAPPRWSDDLAEALGVAGSDAAGAVVRLARALLPFLREHAPDVDRQPELARYLRDGTLERLLA